MKYQEIKQALINCVGLQDKMNTIFNHKPEQHWTKNNNDWFAAILVEIGEFIEHIGHKWWKKQPFNKEQAFMELVDIFHFQLSQILQTAYNNAHPQVEDSVEAEVDLVMSKIAYALINNYKTFQVFSEEDKNNIINFAKSLSTNIYSFTETSLVILFKLTYAIGYTMEDLFSIYTVKNTLNEFRQLNGDRDGTYIKIWNGREDNEVVTELIANDPSLITNLDELKKKIAEKYLIVTNTTESK